MVQVSKQSVQQWMLIEHLARKHGFEEKIAQLEKKYGMTYAEFENRIKTAEIEIFEEWDDSIDWGSYVDFLYDTNQQIEEIKRGNFELTGEKAL